MAFLFPIVLALAAVVALLVRRRQARPVAPLTETKKSATGGCKLSGSPLAIEPLPNFDWQATAPLQLRPFKPTYNITMGTLNYLPYVFPS